MVLSFRCHWRCHLDVKDHIIADPFQAEEAKLIIRKKSILHRQIFKTMLIKFVTRIICYSELNEIKIKI